MLRTKFFFLAMFSMAAAVMVFIWTADPLIAGLLTLGLVFVALVFKPEWGLYPILFTLPWKNVTFQCVLPTHNYETLDVPVVSIPAVLTLAAFIVKQMIMSDQYREDKSPSLRPLYVISILFFIFALCSLTWSLDVLHGIYGLLMLINAFAILVLFSNLPGDKRGVYALLRFATLGGICVAVQVWLCVYYPNYEWSRTVTNGISLHYRLIPGLGASLNRPGGVSNPNWVADTLMIFVFLSVMLAYRSGIRWQIWAWLMFVFFFVSQTETASRACLLLTYVGLCCLIAMLKETHLYAIRLSVVLFFLIIAFVFTFASGMATRLEAVANGTDTAVVTSRLTLWKTGFSYLMKSLGVGLGIGGFQAVGALAYAHSVYLGILFDFGVVGAIVAILFIIFAVWRVLPDVWRLDDDTLRVWSYCMFCALVCIVVHALIDLHYIYLPFWMVLGLMFNIIRMQAEERESKTVVSDSL